MPFFKNKIYHQKNHSLPMISEFRTVLRYSSFPDDNIHDRTYKADLWRSESLLMISFFREVKRVKLFRLRVISICVKSELLIKFFSKAAKKELMYMYIVTVWKKMIVDNDFQCKFANKYHLFFNTQAVTYHGPWTINVSSCTRLDCYTNVYLTYHFNSNDEIRLVLFMST